jgi:hypothetical protein
VRNGYCPKCASTEIYVGTQSPLQAGEGRLHLEANPPKRAVNLMLDAYVCANCGYVEIFVAGGSRDKLESVTQDPRNWRKAH